MSRTEVQRLYAAFFKTEAGLNLLSEIDRQIKVSHEKAEDDPDHARDFVLTAKAAREIKEHISRMCQAARKA